MTLRPLTPADAPAVEALVRAAFHAAYGTTAEVSAGIVTADEKAAVVLHELREASSVAGNGPSGDDAPPPRFTGAFDAGRLLGLAAVRRDAHGRLWLDDLFVDAGARGRGVARALLERALPYGRDVLLEVNEGNATARAAFAALGFTPLVRTVVMRRAAAPESLSR